MIALQTPRYVMTASQTPRGPWVRFWDDRQAVRLKILLLIACVAVATLLEAPR